MEDDPKFPSRFTELAAARARYGDRVDRLGVYLTRVDPLADAAVASFETMPRSAGWALFDRIAGGGGETLRGVPNALRDYFEHAGSVPVWVDWPKVDRGGELLLRAGALGGLVLGLKSLPLAYASPGGNKPLVFSGRLTEQAARRLNETSRFVRATILPGGLRPRAPGFQMTLKVRLIHAQVRRMILQSGRWDTGAWGAPINQHDEAGTLLLFSVAVLDGLRQLGVSLAPDDVEAYIHLWRWSGWLMGVEPDLLPATEQEGASMLDMMFATQGVPDDASRSLTRALLQSPMQSVKDEVGRAAARRAAVGSAVICRALVGNDVADGLGVPRSPFRFIVPFARRLVSGAAFVRANVPFGESSALQAGRRYWDRVADVGLADATAQLMAPERMALRVKSPPAPPRPALSRPPTPLSSPPN